MVARLPLRYTLSGMIYIIAKKKPGTIRAYCRDFNVKRSYIFAAFNLRLLLTTLTELSAIAAPAIIGSSRNPFTG
jgi:hypothetical protein